MDGTITLIPDGGCGFIRPAHGRDDISFLRSALVDVTPERLHLGDRVTCTVVHGMQGKGPHAVDVRMSPPGGTSDRGTVDHPSNAHDQRYM